MKLYGIWTANLHYEDQDRSKKNFLPWFIAWGYKLSIEP
jgi:hypothetical protein